MDVPSNVLPNNFSKAVLLSGIVVPSFNLQTALSDTPVVSQRRSVLVS